MSGPLHNLRRFLRELKRRKVYRVAVTYVIVAFVSLQAVGLLVPATTLPSWADELLVALAVFGFPVALVLAWAFELTPQGMRRTPPPRREEPGAGRRTSWKPLVLGAAALAVLLAGWGTWRFVLKPAETQTAVSPAAIAVLPFSFQGSEELAYLGEGMVSLLTTKFEGAGDLRSVDSRAVLSHTSRIGESPLDPERGRTIARRFRAGLYVLGDIVEVGGRLTINAALYDSHPGSPSLGEATVEGEADGVFGLVDELTARLLASVRRGPEARTARTAALTTSSLPALKAYLEGESALRDGDYRPARDAFERAVEHDTLFALGYYRLSIASEWLTELGPMVEASDRALRHADRLNDRYRRLLSAFRAFRRGQNRDAEELYRSILRTYPDDVEAWLYLAENLFHTNPYRGEPVSEAWTTFARVTEYEPGNAGSLVHMIRIAAMEGRTAALDSLVGRYEGLNPEGDRLLPVRALHEARRGDEAGWQEVIAGLASSAGATVALAIWDVGLFGRDLVRAEELARLLTRPDRSAEERALGFKYLAMTHAARGQWRAAERALSSLEETNAPLALETRAFLYLLPYAPVSGDDLRTVRASLLDLDPSGVPPSGNPSVFFSAHDDLHALIRVYLLGRLSARLGDPGTARDYAEELRATRAPAETGSIREDLFHSLRAEAALQAGDTATALAEVEEIRTDVVYNYAITSFLYSEVHERFLRAELLRSAGRDREALRWYENLVATAVEELPYLALSHLGSGQIQERLGNRTSAASHYRRVVELWRDCDPEVQPLREEARRALARLDG